MINIEEVEFFHDYSDGRIIEEQCSDDGPRQAFIACFLLKI